MNRNQLADRGETSGWNEANNDINGLNDFRMRPIEVAAQAGNVDEFRAIMNHPSFDPTGARPFYFAEVGLGSGGTDADKRYRQLRPVLDVYRARFVSPKH